MSTLKRTRRIFAWRRPLLDALRLDPHISRACKAANISRSSMYAHLRRDPVFRRQWNERWTARAAQLKPATDTGADTSEIDLTRSESRFPMRCDKTNFNRATTSADEATR